MRLLAGFAAVLAGYFLIYLMGTRATAVLVDLFRPGAPAARPSALTLEGTLVYYPDNIGKPVPYLVYTDAKGNAWTKALVFDYGSECLTASGEFACPLIAGALESYFGAGPVSTDGLAEASSLIVRRMSATSSPLH